MGYLVIILFCWCGLIPVQADTLAMGYSPLKFDAPLVGSYELPLLGLAEDGEVLDIHAKTQSLYDLFDNKVIVISFIYSTCSDINGCPLATSVLHQLKSRLKTQPELKNKVKLLTMSFNPQHDTPAVMAEYGRSFSGVNWQFLTTESEEQLQPILKHYQQNLQKIVDKNGKFIGTFSHLLRVFLIDNRRQIRNIYSVSFLHTDTLINDIKTLLLEHPVNKPIPIKYNKSTLSVNIPLGLPALVIPKNNPLTKKKIELGKKLFYDRRLSLNNTISCAMCHIPDQGFGSNEMATAVGIEGQTVRRNAQTLYNVGYFKRLFHDGREFSLEQQVWSPLLATNEMGNPSIGWLLEKIKTLADYQGLFEAAFSNAINMENIGKAIASYERTLNSANSAFDRWYYGHQKDAVNAQVKQGFELFKGKAGCSVCHQFNTHDALFTDQKLHNTGIGFADSMVNISNYRSIQMAEGFFIKVKTEIINSVAEKKANDLGLYEITQNPKHRWQYKTPSLRNIALTAPYMHNGKFNTLQQVVEFYNRGGIANETLSPLIQPLNLNASEIQALVTFLNALTGDNITELVADGLTQPII